MSSTTKFLTGVIIGGALGAIAGILLAPKSGAETRADIADTAKDVLARTDKTIKEIQTKADDVVSDLQKKGEDIQKKIQGLIDKQKVAEG